MHPEQNNPPAETETSSKAPFIDLSALNELLFDEKPAVEPKERETMPPHTEAQDLIVIHSPTIAKERVASEYKQILPQITSLNEESFSKETLPLSPQRDLSETPSLVQQGIESSVIENSVIEPATKSIEKHSDTPLIQELSNLSLTDQEISLKLLQKLQDIDRGVIFSETFSRDTLFNFLMHLDNHSNDHSNYIIQKCLDAKLLKRSTIPSFLHKILDRESDTQYGPTQRRKTSMLLRDLTTITMKGIFTKSIRALYPVLKPFISVGMNLSNNIVGSFHKITQGNSVTFLKRALSDKVSSRYSLTKRARKKI